MKKFITSILILFSVIPSFDIFGQLKSPHVTEISYDRTSGKEHIYWVDSAWNQGVVSEYQIYRFSKYIGTSLPYIVIGTVKFGSGNEYSFKPDTDVEFYAVEACNGPNNLCSADNIARLPWKDAPSNIYLRGSYDSCSNKINLKWNKFYGWYGDTINLFQLFYRTGHGIYRLIKFNGANYVYPNEPIDTFPNKNAKSFQLYPDSDYYFYCQVWYSGQNMGESDNSCLSNVVHLNTKASHAPAYINADGTSVVDNNQVDLNFTVDSITQLHKYYVERSINYYSVQYNIIDSIDTVGWHIKHRDNISSGGKNTSNTQYFYKLAAMNNCKIPQKVEESNAESNIVLKTTYDQNQKSIRVSWTPYQHFPGNYHWKLNRAIGTGAFQHFAEPSESDTSITDNLDTISNNFTVEQVCYYIQAVEDSNIYHFAISNKTCTTVRSGIEMPKFFTPNGDGKNDVYPALKFVPNLYELIIYDRWGTKVFETTTPLGNWNGKYSNGKAAPQGVYMYYLKISGADNKIIEQKGTVVLLLP